jgi:hypothetical protein
MTPCKGQHMGCPACMTYYLKHHANTCTYGYVLYPAGGTSTPLSECIKAKT